MNVQEMSLALEGYAKVDFAKCKIGCRTFDRDTFNIIKKTARRLHEI